MPICPPPGQPSIFLYQNIALSKYRLITPRSLGRTVWLFLNNHVQRQDKTRQRLDKVLQRQDKVWQTHDKKVTNTRHRQDKVRQKQDKDQTKTRRRRDKWWPRQDKDNDTDKTKTGKRQDKTREDKTNYNSHLLVLICPLESGFPKLKRASI